MSALTDHYVRKYRDEELAELPPRPPRPTDRASAARLMLPALLPGRPSVLELGAGSGLMARMLLADGMQFGRYVASELPGPRLDLLRRLEPLGIEAVEINADDLSPTLGTFDAVLMIALVEHLLDPLRSLTAVREMLNPGGFVWIDTPNIAKWTRRLKLAAGKFPSTASVGEGLVTYAGAPVDLYDEGHLHYFTFRSLERVLVERCGFGRVVRRPYPIGVPSALSVIANGMPTLFSEVCVVAYAP